MGCFESKQTKAQHPALRSSLPNAQQFKVQCKICMQKYNLTNRLPLSLPCFHSICLQCLNSLPKKECPFDHKSFTEYGKNFELIEAIQTFSGKKIKKIKQESQIKVSPVKNVFKKDREPAPMERIIPRGPSQPIQAIEPRRVDQIDVNLERIRPPQRIFAPRRQNQLSPLRNNPNPEANACQGGHKFSFLAYQVKCNACSNNTRCSQCNICRRKECINCYKIEFRPQKCPNNHPTKWSNHILKCTQCTRLQSGKTCTSCSYNLCDTCCGTVFAKKCPNKHDTKWVSYKDKCVQCKNFARGYHCVSCSYHYCESCSGIRFGKDRCPNNHETVARSIRSTCTKCSNVELGKSCTTCLFHICDKCK